MSFLEGDYFAFVKGDFMCSIDTDIIFLRPPIIETDPRFEPILESLGIEYIVANCRQENILCTYIDANLQNYTITDVCDIIRRAHPKFVGITITTEQIRDGTKTIINAISKLEPRPIICVGGHFVSYAYNEVLKSFPAIDVVCIGEGEYIICDLVKAVLSKVSFHQLEGIAFRHENEIIYNPNVARKIMDLDTLPWPVRDYTKEAIDKSQLFCMISSRGCYGSCKFCAINNFTKKFQYRKWRGRNIVDVVKELKYGVKKLGAKYILICDDNFTAPGTQGKQRLQEFIDEMSNDPVECEFGFFCRANDVIQYQNFMPKLKSIGLNHMFVGVESASQRALNYYKKGITPEISKESIRICKENDICVEIGFIFFEPFTTLDEVILNLKFLKEIQMNSILRLNTKLSIYYGSDYIADLEKNGLIIQNGYEISYNYVNPEIEYVEKMFNKIFEYTIPLLSLFYDKKDCVTSTWYRKKSEEISNILSLEQLINDSITDFLIEKLTYVNNFIGTKSLVTLESFFQECTTEIIKRISEYTFLTEAYFKQEGKNEIRRHK